MNITSALPSRIISNDYLQEEFPNYNVLKLGKKIGVLVAKYTTIPSKSLKKLGSSSEHFDGL